MVLILKDGQYMDGINCKVDASNHLTSLKKSSDIKWILECYRRYLIKESIKSDEKLENLSKFSNK